MTTITTDEKFCDPVWIRRLLEKGMMVKEIADALGCDNSHITNIKKGHSNCRKAYDLAAEFLYRQKFGTEHNNQRIAVVFADQPTIDFVQHIVERDGGKITIVL